MELNREEIIKDLQEVVDNYSGSWKRYDVFANALALIKELIEENERLSKLFEYCADDGEYWEGKYNNAVGNTVRKFADYLKKHSFMCDPGNGHSFDAIDMDELDDYVKEFLEDEDEEI